MQCLQCVEREHRKPFLHFLSLFLTVLYCNCVKLKYAPCCVVSSLCPNDSICVKTTGPDAKSKRSVDLSLVRFFFVVCITVGSGSFPALPPSRTACFSPWKAATGSAGKLEAAVHSFAWPQPQASQEGDRTTAHTKHTKLLLLLLQKSRPTHFNKKTEPWLNIKLRCNIFKIKKKSLVWLLFVGIFNVQSFEIILTEYT